MLSEGGDSHKSQWAQGQRNRWPPVDAHLTEVRGRDRPTPVLIYITISTVFETMAWISDADLGTLHEIILRT
jgi:hypothetical protein